MEKELTPQPLRFEKDLKGITLNALKEHYKLYEGYVRKTVEIRSEIMQADLSKANATYSILGELRREETFAVNGMKLHELFFEELSGDGKPAGKLVEEIENQFGSFEYWKENIIASAMTTRGWAILAWDIKEKMLRNYAADSHNLGAVWESMPILVLDVYEHAYFMDYGTNRKKYLEDLFDSLNWEVLNKRMM